MSCVKYLLFNICLSENYTSCYFIIACSDYDFYRRNAENIIFISILKLLASENFNQIIYFCNESYKFPSVKIALTHIATMFRSSKIRNR